MKSPAAPLTVLTLLLAALPAHAQVDARMLRSPDVSATQITFVYGGDIWVAPKTGGAARRLSSPKGEESFPRFSPDSRTIAFSGNYDGNTDVYTLPASGGPVTRVTHHPMDDRLVDWTPGGALLYASSMESGRQRYNQFYRTAPEGGMPEKLPVPYGEFGALAPDGRTLAYTPKSRVFRTWKRYRGGTAPDLWLFDLETLEAQRVAPSDANDELPMWHGGTLYFLSDRGPAQRYNVWAYDRSAQSTRQVTRFADMDVHFPAIGPSDMVFEAGGRLYRMGLADEEPQPLDIDVVTDEATLKPRTVSVGENVQDMTVSPSGQRALLQARGEIFSLPAEYGPVRNLTRTSGTAERYPAWSPDGQQVAYFSDATGEYELTVRPANGLGEERTLTTLGPGYRYQPQWSPDSRKLAFIDKAMQIHVYDLDAEQETVVDQGQWMYQGELDGFTVSWSPDSRWLAYARGLDNRQNALFLYDTENSKRHQVTSGFYHDTAPVFGPDGDYLYLLTGRHFAPSYSNVDNSFTYANTTQVAAVSLRADVASPLAPRNDEEGAEEDEEDEENSDKKEESKDDDKEEKTPAPVTVDLDRFEARMVVLPPEAGNYADLQAAPGKVVYRRLPLTGMPEDAPSPVVFYDLKEREEKTVLEDSGPFQLTADGEKLLATHDDAFAIVELKPDQKMETPLRTGEMEMTLDPMAEWQQIFADAWRLERDFFYDPNMHGVDWEAMRQQYGALIDDAVTRWDVNFVLGELIGELNASHTYRGGGDTEETAQRGVGLLGVDWALEHGAYRIARILRGAPWDIEVRSPLDRAGVDVSEGDYVLAVNGIPLDPEKDPWAAFEGLAGEPVALTVNDAPTMDGARAEGARTEGAREVIVKTMEDATPLRHLAWMDANRRRVEEATDGRVGYVYVPNTGVEGQTELVRQFAAQYEKPGLIIDERFNSGGQIPDRFIELLNRPPLAFWAVRDGADWQWPPAAHFGPQVMLINGWSGSGGDAFPAYFKEQDLGPLIGTRTWGGLIGYTGVPDLIDGGAVTVPTFRMYSPDGTWFAEGHGVEPDIEIGDDPSLLARGTDPQLERAIQETLRRIEKQPLAQPERPPYEDRTSGAAQR